ncbi:superoxide dismutase [Mn], mitochondrial-like [Cimex lectularius]|uniref:Superoxide dismutase n=1 Tax=Cimex lectularius TaxID=79782 RepID=A0A8I6SA25_CIMLE|nr:superoxide dismutase [Mn], mitochondrial-like [Cimex lectularius]
MISIKVIFKCASKFGCFAKRLHHTLPSLPYAYDALEPVICREMLELHHNEYHRSYVKNLNVTLQGMENAISTGDLNTALCLQPVLKLNGGGHINHSILWSTLSPDGGCPSDELCREIIASFGTLDNLMDRMILMTYAVESSGWVWLGYNPYSSRLQITTCTNENPLQATTGLIPLFGIDLWEHAYHLQYKRNKVDYARFIFQVVNWLEVSRRYCEAYEIGQAWKKACESNN